ncbi:hypothetical protein ACG33_03080 [Steroidobacter denitrificans]|uniref:Methyltransferase type 12 n=1 Tax=Steroidobacter denitrificans TaxID=465721 RepID=A0A127F916_STEDE|nr:class I SAM-dependent methyltransferase [Steroidobacter denitrificans]AMN46108.1 hypothetical protein ACG33_03080 [Steroidobacter denitrificans]
MNAVEEATRCPLCAHARSIRLATLDAAVLREEYLRSFKIHIRMDVERIDYLHCTACDLRFFEPLAAGDADFYRQLQAIPWYYREQKAEYDIAAHHIRPEDQVLEVGAGKGAFSRHVRCASYLGLETSPDAIEIAAREGVRLLQEDLQTHASRHVGEYDVVCAFQVLEHVPQVCSFLESARDCLRSGGRLLLAVPSEDSFANIDFWDILNMPPHHVTRWSDLSLRNAARQLGLSVVTIEHEPLADSHVSWYARIVAEYGMALRSGPEPHLLDPRLRGWLVRRGAKIGAALLRPALRNPVLRPIGHAVVAVFERAPA